MYTNLPRGFKYMICMYSYILYCTVGAAHLSATIPYSFGIMKSELLIMCLDF
jgi:hypothetical protein